jgi:hypothetical protein
MASLHSPNSYRIPFSKSMLQPEPARGVPKTVQDASFAVSPDLAQMSTFHLCQKTYDISVIFQLGHRWYPYWRGGLPPIPSQKSRSPRLSLYWPQVPTELYVSLPSLSQDATHQSSDAGPLETGDAMGKSAKHKSKTPAML